MELGLFISDALLREGIAEGRPEPIDTPTIFGHDPLHGDCTIVRNGLSQPDRPTNRPLTALLRWFRPVLSKRDTQNNNIVPAGNNIRIIAHDN